MKKIWAYILIICILFETTSIYALTKEENVYAKLKSTGEIDNVLISQHLSNFTGKSITDKSILSNIKNLNGKETYTIKVHIRTIYLLALVLNII